jgi:glycosyltransferase involved in cell wall biosynthesis
MKIAFLSFYNGKIDRGVEVATKELVKKFSLHHNTRLYQAGSKVEEGVATEVVEMNLSWPTDSSSSKLRAIYLDYYSLKILLFTIKCLPKLWKEKYQIIIAENGGWQLLLIKLFTKIKGGKVLVQGNAGIGRDDHWQLLLRPDYYIAISPVGLEWAQKIAPKIHSKYIPYGVDLKAFDTAKKAIVALKTPIVLCVSAFLPYKRIDLLITAMQNVAGASLLVIGQGPLKEYLENLGGKLLGDRFLLKTGIAHEELLGYYKTAQVFSLPSAESEALGIVYIEAMAANIPVVAPNDPNKRIIIGVAGVFVDVTDVDAYGLTITSALKTDFGNKPREQAEKYAWDQIALEYEKVLNQL